MDLRNEEIKSVLITKFYLTDQCKSDEGGAECGKYGRGERPYSN